MADPSLALSRALNLVVPTTRDDGSTIWAHSTLLSYEVFCNYAILAGQLMNALLSRGLGLFAPRYALDMLRTVVQENGPTDPELAKQFKAAKLKELDEGLLAEINRLTVLRMPNGNGWKPVPLIVAKQRQLLTKEEADRLQSAILFFICGSRSSLREELPAIESALKLWNAQTTSASYLEFVNSLPTSTAGASSGAIPTA